MDVNQNSSEATTPKTTPPKRRGRKTTPKSAPQTRTGRKRAADTIEQNANKTIRSEKSNGDGGSPKGKKMAATIDEISKLMDKKTAVLQTSISQEIARAVGNINQTVQKNTTAIKDVTERVNRMEAKITTDNMRETVGELMAERLADRQVGFQPAQSTTSSELEVGRSSKEEDYYKARRRPKDLASQRTYPEGHMEFGARIHCQDTGRE